jgi:flagellar biogenesis protein FliO
MTRLVVPAAAPATVAARMVGSRPMRIVLVGGAIALLMIAETGAAAERVAGPATRTTRDPLGDLPSYGEAVKHMVIALLAIIAALLLVAKFLPQFLGKPRAAGAGGKMIDVVESYRLEPRKSIYLVRVGGQYFLLGSTGDRLDTLAGAPLDGEKIAAALRTADGKPPPETKPSRSFAELLKGKRRQGLTRTDA